jgi:hypothetical protein
MIVKDTSYDTSFAVTPEMMFYGRVPTLHRLAKKYRNEEDKFMRHAECDAFFLGLVLQHCASLITRDLRGIENRLGMLAHEMGMNQEGRPPRFEEDD